MLSLLAFAAVPEKILLDLDFQEQALPGLNPGCLVEGHTGRGLLFAQENLPDFADLGENLPRQDAIIIPLPEFSEYGGEFSFRYRPYFNQTQPYRERQGEAQRYLLADFSDGEESSLQIEIVKQSLSAGFRLANGKVFTIRASVADWQAKQWRLITVRWTPFLKEILLDGEQVANIALSGELAPKAKHIKLGGKGQDCSAQGVFDDLKLISLRPEIRETFSDLQALLANWEFLQEEGAEGELRIDNSIKSRSGMPSLQMVKSNNKGYLMLRRREALELPKAVTYRVGGSFHSRNADVTNTLCFRVQENDDYPYYYHVNPNSGEVYTTYSRLTNSPPGEWIDSFYYVIPPERKNPPQQRAVILLRGAACTVNIDELRVEAVAPHPKGYPGPDAKCHWDAHIPLEEPILSEAEAYEKVKNREPARLTIRQNHRTPELLCNGKLMIPAAYRVQGWNKNCRYYEMYYLGGTELLMVPVTAGGYSSVNIMKGIGDFDFTIAEEDFIRALRRAPDAVYLMQVGARPYPGMDADLDEVWQNRQGLLGVCNNQGMLYVNQFVKEKSGTQEYYPSYASPKWRQYCADAVVAYVRHLREKGLLNAVGAFTIAMGEDGQFLTGLAKFDCSPVARRGFSQFLQNKYGTVERLRAVWRDPDATFDFPTPQSMPNPVMPPGVFRNPQMDVKALDAVAYHYALQLDTMNYFAERIEEAAGRPMLFITSSWGGNLPYQDQIAIGSTRLHGTSPQLRYPDRRPGRPIANQTALDSMRANASIDFQELDLRTYTRRVTPAARARDYLSHARTPEMFKNISRRQAGFQIAKSQGFWYYDMAQEFADSEILKIIKRSNEIFREVAATPDQWKPDVAVVYDLFSIKTLSNGLSGRLEHWIASSLLPSGVPYDMFYLNDFLQHPERRDYKTIIFCSTLFLRPEEREIIQSLKSQGRTLVFMYAPGYLDPAGTSVQSMNQLCEINCREDGSDLLDMEPAGTHLLASGLEGVLGIAGYYNYACYMRSHEKRMHLPRFVIDDDQAEIIGRYLSDGKPGIAIRRFQDWNSILVSSPDALSARLLHNIAKWNGSFVATDKTGCQLSMRDNFMSIHALRGGQYTFTFPAKGNIHDADSDQLLAEKDAQVTIDIEAGETRWLIKR